MKTLTSFASKIIVDNHNNNNRDRGFLSSKGFRINNKPKSLFFQSKKLFNARFLQYKAAALQPVSALSSSDGQAKVETGAQTLAAYESKTVHVKFQLQKECLFGEQFFLVGDDPMLGLWDPTSAIPLDWSDGHIWTAEIDVPVSKTIQCKFILKGKTGQIVWQPGPDRIFQAWETKNTITVFEDWEHADEQKIIEEDPTVTSKMLVAENFTQPEEAPVSNIDNNPVAVDSDVNSAEVPEKPMSIVAENISCPTEDPMSTAINQMLGEKQISQPDAESADNKNSTIEQEILGSSGRAAADDKNTKTKQEVLGSSMIKNLTAENIGYPKEDTVPNASDKMLGEKQSSQPEKKENVLKNGGGAATINSLTADNISYPKEKSSANKNMMTEDVLGNNGRATANKNLASTDVEGNLITPEGDAVLVPGLTPLPKSDEGEFEEEDRKSISVDASVGINEAMNYNSPEMRSKNVWVIDVRMKRLRCSIMRTNSLKMNS
ncbi:hypothetical protein KPL70_017900 [Citrus sinensis]|uniref:uncharacterized protein LOC102625633 isoform X2 n=1 Tax=Citrus sinensis TaxID=2711 RepID=UPI000763957C|nr:uncharacterized protein LOC102625633 isoform X2 [Citrus sinensis]KAH9672869.1 hypothetical protein KPL70_017900 [Citrus sinensis]